MSFLCIFMNYLMLVDLTANNRRKNPALPLVMCPLYMSIHRSSTIVFLSKKIIKRCPL